VDPPTIDETIEILKGLRKKYEDHHRVVIPDETLVDAAKLSERYITDRFLPDKAIDVIDEAGARARLASQVPPAEVANLKADLEKVNVEKEDAVRDQNFERAAALRPETRILFMSGHPEDTVIRHGVPGRPGEYLQKPFNPDAVARKVRETLDAPRAA